MDAGVNIQIHPSVDTEQTERVPNATNVVLVVLLLVGVVVIRFSIC